MKGIRNVVIAIKLNEDLGALRTIKQMEYLNESNIYLVHYSKMNETAEAKLVIEQSVIKKLEEYKSSIRPGNFVGEIISECHFSSNPKKDFSSYLAQLRPDLVMLIPPQKQSFFGSFIHYQFIHTNANLFIVRP